MPELEDLGSQLYRSAGTGVRIRFILSGSATVTLTVLAGRQWWPRCAADPSSPATAGYLEWRD